MIRYFRSSSAVYAEIARQLDEAYGYPKPELKTERVLPLVDELPADGEGRVYLAVSADYCEYNLPSQMLAEMVASGAVEEIDEATYRSAAA